MDAPEREAGILAGADECVGRRVSNLELDARIRAARRIVELESVLRITLEENRKLSATDDLTRAASRRFFGQHFPREVERAARYKRALSLVLCDIDHFKKINDTLGHAVGDEILQQFGARACRRPCAVGLTGWRGSAGRNLPSSCRRPLMSRRSRSRASCGLPSPHTHFKAGTRASR